MWLCILIHKGAIDTLDTFFFAVTAEGNGTLEDADFQAPAQAILSAVLPVPSASSQSTDTFSFSVTDFVQTALEQGFDFFSFQGRVDESLVDSARGLELFTTCDYSLQSEWPQLVVVPQGPARFTFSIASLPQAGTLFVNGLPITTPGVVSGPHLIYTPNAGFADVDHFTYQVTKGSLISQIATVSITVGDLVQTNALLSVMVTGMGKGTVRTDIGQHSCGNGTCTVPIPLHSQVTLTAGPDVVGNTFAGWSGDCTGSLASTSITLDGNKTCIATFGLESSTTAQTDAEVDLEPSIYLATRTSATLMNCGTCAKRSWHPLRSKQIASLI